MHRNRLFGFIILALASVGRFLERAFEPLFELFKPDPLAFAGTPRLSIEGHGGHIGADAVTLQRGRHEAGVSRRSADRKN